jgi:AcrR family transcriptional regulator
MPRTKSGSYHHGSLRTALIAAAEVILEEEGLEAVGLRAIARRVGVSHAAPYHHFRNADALLAAVATDGFDRLREAMGDAAGQAAGDDFERLRGVGLAYVLFAWDHPALYRLMFGPLMTHQDDSSLRTVGLAARQVLLDGLAAAGIPASRLEEVGAAAWGLVHGHALLLLDGLAGPSAPTREEVIRLTEGVLAVLGRGLRSPGDATAS